MTQNLTAVPYKSLFIKLDWFHTWDQIQWRQLCSSVHVCRPCIRCWPTRVPLSPPYSSAQMLCGEEVLYCGPIVAPPAEVASAVAAGMTFMSASSTTGSVMVADTSLEVMSSVDTVSTEHMGMDSVWESSRACLAAADVHWAFHKSATCKRHIGAWDQKLPQAEATTTVHHLL